MKAMVLCAGYGTRLGALTQDTPKPLMEAGGVSLAGHILTNLGRHGFRDVILNVHHHADKIREGLAAYHGRGLHLSYSHEETLLGTAGGVKKVESFFAQEQAFLVHYGDVVTDVNLSDMLEFHLQKKAAATLLVHSRKKSNSALKFDETFCVREFVERPPEAFWKTIDTTWVNSGVMLFSPSVLGLIPSSAASDWPRDIFPQLIPSGGVFAYPLKGYRIAVDSPERLDQLRDDIAAGKLSLASSSLG